MLCWTARPSFNLKGFYWYSRSRSRFSEIGRRHTGLTSVLDGGRASGRRKMEDHSVLLRLWGTAWRINLDPMSTESGI
jgi:hypothetical protein